MTVLTAVRFIVGTIVVLCWLGILGALPRRKKHNSEDKKSDRNGMIGFILQEISYLLVFPFHFAHLPKALDYLVLIASLSFAIAALVLMRASVRHLGKQWSINARVLEDHKLITDGPYSLVRHPIYTAMLGILLANVLLFHAWIAAIPALICLFIGTQMRVTSEEKLLHQEFGKEFEEYQKRVPAIIPGL